MFGRWNSQAPAVHTWWGESGLVAALFHDLSVRDSRPTVMVP